MSFNGSPSKDSAMCQAPGQTTAHSGFGSPFESEDPFSQGSLIGSTHVGALVAPMPRRGSGSQSPLPRRGSGSQSPVGAESPARAIIESTQALEAELHSLRQSHEEKDCEIAALKASIALTFAVAPGANGEVRRDSTAYAAADDLADVIKAIDETEVAAAQAYNILSPAFSHLRRAYEKGCDLPVVGGVARVGLRAADACVSRMSKWSSCEDIGKDVDGFLQYVDEQVLTPHLHAARSSSLALCDPALRKADPLLVASSALLAALRSAPRGFVEAFGRRAAAPAAWLREALRSWYGTPPGRLAMEDKLSGSAAAASNGGVGIGVGQVPVATGDVGSDGTWGVASEEQVAEVSHE